MKRLLSPALLVLAACSASAPSSQPEQQIIPGNGELNVITLDDLKRVGSTLIVSEVLAEEDSFLVLHPFEDGAPVRTDYTGAIFVEAGLSTDVMVRLDSIPDPATPFIIMLHEDVDRDSAFQFGDGVTVPDAPVIEGNTIIAIPMQTPPETAVTPAIIANSGQEQAEKADAYRERAPYRNAEEAQVMALIHDYLYAVEGPEDPTRAQLATLFADDFRVNFPTGPITSVDAFRDWAAYARETFHPTRHDLHDVRISALGNDRMQVKMEMIWDGIANGSLRMTARTRHDWQVDISDADRPKIEQIDVEILEQFQAAEWEEE